MLSGHRADWTFVPHRVGRATLPFFWTGDFVTGVHPAEALPKRMGKARGLLSCERGFWSRAPGRGGAPVSSLRFFVQSRDFLSLPPLLCKARTPKTLLPGPFHAVEASFPTSSSGAGPRDTTVRGQFPVGGTARKTGLAGLTQSWPADVTASLPYATPPG